MTGLEVLRCGPGMSVQDGGRRGFRRFGVSVAGAVDLRALAFANALAGNPPDTAAIEVALIGAAFRIGEGEILLATSPGLALAIDGEAVRPGSAVRAGSGASVTVGPLRGRVYGYLAVAGGIRTAPEMGSRAVHARSGVGGRPLRPGEHVPCAPAPANLPLWRLPEPAAGGEEPIRVVPGPQEDRFTAEALETFLGSVYRVEPRSDRMGVRLAGPRLTHLRGYNIVSDGVLPGSVQVPGDGQPIVLLADCQTTGGYPKIATVISADLGRLAQIPPGGSLRFAAVSLDGAVAAARHMAAEIAALAGARQRSGEIASVERLLSQNLIGGVVDARG